MLVLLGLITRQLNWVGFCGFWSFKYSIVNKYKLCLVCFWCLKHPWHGLCRLLLALRPCLRFWNNFFHLVCTDMFSECNGWKKIAALKKSLYMYGQGSQSPVRGASTATIREKNVKQFDWMLLSLVLYYLHISIHTLCIFFNYIYVSFEITTHL